MQFHLSKLNPFHPSYARARKWILRLISLSWVFMVLFLRENDWNTIKFDPSEEQVVLPRMSPLFLLPPYSPFFNLFRLGGLATDTEPKVAETIFLDNPSFENAPCPGQTPSGWFDCGAEGASPPDIQPGAFGVSVLPVQGVSYVGLVVRDNATWESIAQRLSYPLVKGKTYTFSLDLARSDVYFSVSAIDRDSVVQYTKPVVLRVWGGAAWCDREELLYQTNAVKSTRWERYNLVFSPQHDHYEYFILEAYYQYPLLFPYCGNLLVDNCSVIRLVN